MLVVLVVCVYVVYCYYGFYGDDVVWFVDYVYVWYWFGGICYGGVGVFVVFGCFWFVGCYLC